MAAVVRGIDELKKEHQDEKAEQVRVMLNRRGAGPAHKHLERVLTQDTVTDQHDNDDTPQPDLENTLQALKGVARMLSRHQAYLGELAPSLGDDQKEKVRTRLDAIANVTAAMRAAVEG